VKYAGLLFLVLSLPSLADQPKTPAPTPWSFPPLSNMPTPEPPLTPQPVPVKLPPLTTDKVYAFSFPDACFLLASPAGLVSVTQEPGPAKIHAKFLDGPDKYEWRTFSGPAVFTVTAIGTGSVELLVVKIGAKGEADVARRTVEAQLGPRPPPEPPTPTDPLFPLAQAAYSADPSPTKASDVLVLAQVYRGVAAGMDATIKTDQDVYTVTQSVRKQKIGDRLAGVRTVLNVELSKLFGGDAAGNIPIKALTDADRAAVVSLYKRYAAVLETLK